MNLYLEEDNKIDYILNRYKDITYDIINIRTNRIVINLYIS